MKDTNTKKSVPDESKISQEEFSFRARMGVRNEWPSEQYKTPSKTKNKSA